MSNQAGPTSPAQTPGHRHQRGALPIYQTPHTRSTAPNKPPAAPCSSLPIPQHLQYPDNEPDPVTCRSEHRDRVACWRCRARCSGRPGQAADNFRRSSTSANPRTQSCRARALRRQTYKTCFPSKNSAQDRHRGHFVTTPDDLELMACAVRQTPGLLSVRPSPPAETQILDIPNIAAGAHTPGVPLIVRQPVAHPLPDPSLYPRRHDKNYVRATYLSHQVPPPPELFCSRESAAISVGCSCSDLSGTVRLPWPLPPASPRRTHSELTTVWCSPSSGRLRSRLKAHVQLLPNLGSAAAPFQRLPVRTGIKT